MFKPIELIKEFISTLLDLIYPEQGICFICEGYDENTGEDHICTECRNKLVFINENRCTICGKPLELGYLQDKCPDCIQSYHYFTKAISPLEYCGIIKNSIYKYKYGKKSYMYKSFGSLMVQALEDNNIDEIHMVVPVPLHRKKKIDRGFNQAELLGKYIAKYFQVPIDSKNLIRVKNTAIQNKLKRTERKKNIKNAFKVKNHDVFKDNKILLIDDILTTGATADECSRELLKAGAEEVYVVTIATGRNVF